MPSDCGGGNCYNYGIWHRISQGVYSFILPAPLIYLYLRHYSTTQNAWIGILLLLGYYYAMIKSWVMKLYILPLEIRFNEDSLELMNLSRSPECIRYKNIKEVRFRKSRGWEPSRFVAEVVPRSTDRSIPICSNVKQGPERLADAFSEKDIAVINETGYSLDQAR
jgi:hypothetical protein